MKRQAISKQKQLECHVIAQLPSRFVLLSTVHPSSSSFLPPEKHVLSSISTHTRFGRVCRRTQGSSGETRGTLLVPDDALKRFFFVPPKVHSFYLMQICRLSTFSALVDMDFRNGTRKARHPANRAHRMISNAAQCAKHGCSKHHKVSCTLTDGKNP